jgi:hypothetical protein
MIGIIAIGLPGGDLIEPLGQEVVEGMVDIGRMPLIMNCRGKACGAATLAVDAPEQEDATGER